MDSNSLVGVSLVCKDRESILSQEEIVVDYKKAFSSIEKVMPRFLENKPSYYRIGKDSVYTDSTNGILSLMEYDAKCGDVTISRIELETNKVYYDKTKIRIFVRYAREDTDKAYTLKYKVNRGKKVFSLLTEVALAPA